MKNLSFLGLGVIIFFLAGACQNNHAKSDKNAAIDSAGKTFIKSALEGGLTEIKASGLVITNSNNQQVISLAKMMINDHTNADSTLTKLETNKLISGNDSISTLHQQMINTLAKQTGTAFDKAYLMMMVADHQAAFDLFTKAGGSTDEDVNKLAAAILPTIKMHLDSASSILTRLK